MLLYSLHRHGLTSQLDHMRRLRRLLVIVIGRCAVCLVRWWILVVQKLDRRSGLRIIRGVLLVLWSTLVGRCIRGGYGWIVRCSVDASLSLFLCAVVANS